MPSIVDPKLAWDYLRLLQELKDLQKELAESNSMFSAVFADGYDTGKHSAADSLQEIIEKYNLPS